MADAPIYLASVDGALRQGEIVSGVVQLKVALQRGELPDLNASSIPTTRVTHPFAIVVSQDCDLDWDRKYRDGGSNASKEVPNVLFCEARTAAEIRSGPGIDAGIWKTVKINKNERYQFLEQVPAGADASSVGLPELCLDFKRLFTIPTDEVYLQLASGAQRRCRLNCPYLEHLSSRLLYFLGRVALPGEHQSEPEAR